MQEIIQYRRAEGIVHDTIQFTAQEVTSSDVIGNFNGSILPNLPKHKGIRLYFAGCTLYAGNHIVRQFICHIQPPAGSTQFQPFLDYAINEFTEALVALVIRGHDPYIPPALIFVREFAEPEPGIIGRFFPLISTYTRIGTKLVEIEAVVPGVVEYPIENHTHPHLPGFLTKLGKFVFTAKHRINLMIITGVVTVIGFRKEDRIQIQIANSKGF